MARLFEQFVAEWLRGHLPPEWSLEVQRRFDVGQGEASLRFDIDLVLSQGSERRPLAVLDTKYKADDRPSTADVSQVVAYAELHGCERAFLVYPAPLPLPLDVRVGRIRVQSLVYPLEGDLEAGGAAFCHRLESALADQNPAPEHRQRHPTGAVPTKGA
jgi:5-methylcytosine-specific restriction enzyme subunit McrC